jgi:PEP-CTERM motif
MMKLFNASKLAIMLLLGSMNVYADSVTTLSVGALPTQVAYGNTAVVASIGNSFWDSFFFTVPESTATSVTTTINLSNLFALSNVSARLYNGGVHDTSLVVPGTIAEAFATTTNIAPGVDVSTVALSANMLSAGTYTLQIRGNVTGSLGGAYTGLLNLAPPIPEPETYALLLAGLGLVGGFARLKRKISFKATT